MRKNTNTYIKSVQKSLSLCAEWDSTKNELPISSLTKKKSQNKCIIIVSLLLHILTLSEKLGAYSGHCISGHHTYPVLKALQKQFLSLFTYLH